MGTMTFWLLKAVSFFDLLPRALAQGGPISNPPSSNTQLENPIGCDDLGCVATKIIDALFVVSIPIVAIMVLVGGFQIVTAGGNEEKYKLGRKTILYAAGGFVVILLADSVAGILESIFKPQ